MTCSESIAEIEAEILTIHDRMGDLEFLGQISSVLLFILVVVVVILIFIDGFS